MTNLTKRNHYNPCFWTALWNEEYYRLAKSGSHHSLKPREQPVHALSVKSDLIFATTVERVHFEKYLGIAEITREAAADCIHRYHPGEYESFMEKSKTSHYPVFIDFEDVLTAIEGMAPY